MLVCTYLVGALWHTQNEVSYVVQLHNTCAEKYNKECFQMAQSTQPMFNMSVLGLGFDGNSTHIRS